MSITYQVGLDKDGDGFIGWDVNTTDPPNLAPTPVTWQSFVMLPVNGGQISKWEETPYGTQIVDVSLDPGAAAFYCWRSLAGVNTLPVTPGQTYTVGLWVRGGTAYPTVLTSLTVYNQTLTSRASQSISIAAGWAQFSVTFTAQAGDTHITLALEKPSLSPTISFDATGFMMVAGSALPATFNAGDPSAEAADDITDDVLTLKWRLGLARPYDVTAAPTRGEIVLENSAGTYSPERTTTTLAPGTRLMIRADDGGGMVRLFSGWISSVEVEPGQFSGRRVTLHLHGPERILDEARVLISLLLNASPTGILNTIFLREPLDRLNTQFQQSSTSFAYAGDTWADGIRAATAIEQVMTAERGRFYSQRDGTLTFLERGYTYGSSQHTFDDAFEDVAYVYGVGLVNEVRVLVRPRSLGTAGSTLWTLQTAQAIPAGECRTLLARFRDSNSASIGATSLVTPVATTDYTANSTNDGSGTDVTADVSITIVDGGSASAAYLQICNTGTATAYLQPGTRLRGRPLFQEDTLLIEQRDDASIDAYGLYSLTFNLPYFVTVAEAEALADAILTARKTPRGTVEALHLSHRVGLSQALSRTLFDVITVKEAHTGHDADYLIIAEAHEVDLGGARHHVRWLLEQLE